MNVINEFMLESLAGDDKQHDVDEFRRLLPSAMKYVVDLVVLGSANSSMLYVTFSSNR
jgi:hypothetical protein